jgi:mycothiol synthase
MSTKWRIHTLHMPQYRPELDLVVVAPDGALAGFCIGWLDQRRRVGQIEPMGVHSRFQRLGLSQALLQEILRRFQALGADFAQLETDLERNAARHTYESAGFREAHIIQAKGKWIGQEA